MRTRSESKKSLFAGSKIAVGEFRLNWGWIIAAALVITALPCSAQGPLANGQRPAWPDPVAHEVVPYQSSELTHGPLVGRPGATSMRVWVRTRQPTEFRVVYAQSLPLSADSPSVVGRTTAETDQCGVVELSDLKPATRYYYGILSQGRLVDTRLEFDRPWPSFRTLPDASVCADPLNNPDGKFNLAFSIGCCQRQRAQRDQEQFGIYGNPPALATLWNRHRDHVAFHITHGDFIYEETLDGTAEGLAENYRLYLDRGRNLANLHRYVPLVTIYDDHEVNSNLDGAGEVGLGDGNFLKRDLALRVWRDYVGWTTDPAPHKTHLRFGRGTVKADDELLVDPGADFSGLRPDQVSTLHVGPYLQGDGQSRDERGGKNIGVYRVVEVLDEHRLRVEPSFKADGEVPYSIGTHHYFDRQIGNCHFFYTDMRGERSRWLGVERSHDPDRFILGPTQRQWLIESARKSDAEFLFIISADPWTIYHSAYHVAPERGTVSKGDGFCGYVHEREILLEALDEIDKPVLIFTGDVHNSLAVQVTDNVWEFVIGPMNSAGHPVGTLGLPPFGGLFDSEGRTVKIKWIAGFPDNVHYSRQRNTYFGVVNVNNVMRAARPDGVGYQWVPYDEPQVVVQFYDGYTGRLEYAEGISTLDAKRDPQVAPKVSRWPPKAE